MINQPKQSPENIKATLGKVQTWMQRQANPNAINNPTSTNTVPTGRAVSLSAAKQLPSMQGKSDDEIRAAIVAAGHQVVP